MEIRILHLLEGARAAEGLTVIIDVFRAFSVAPLLISKGVNKIIPVDSVNTALQLKSEHPEYILIGEVNEVMVDGFDVGNCPTHIKEMDLHNKTVIHRTSSGTQGLLNAVNADEIITGSFVNAGAIIRYIQQKNPQIVSLVCMGYACEYQTEEDNLCAQYIKDKLEGKEFNLNDYIPQLMNGSGARFFDPSKIHISPPSDFYFCLQTDVFNVVLRLENNQLMAV